MRPETIIVETENGPVLINKEDFDPAFHRLPGEATETAIPDGAGTPLDANGLRTDGPTVAEYVAAGYSATNYPPAGYASRSTSEEIAAALKPAAPVAAAPAAIDANGNPVNAGDGGQFVPPQTPSQSVSPPPVLLVTKNDKKRFVVVDMEQKAVTADGIDADGYKTEKEAWDAINAHISKLSGATA